MHGESPDLRKRLKLFATSGPVGPARATPPFDEDYLIRCLAYLLRHSANDRGVALDSRGWASVDEIVDVLRRMHWSLGDLSADAVTDFVLLRASDRFEAAAGQVRARYGHSVLGLTVGEPELPPEVLFHGTSLDVLPSIRELGLRPMSRLHVHLTTDVGYARRVAELKSACPVVIWVRVRQACAEGAVFRRAASHVWLAGTIEPRFLETDTNRHADFDG